MTIEPPAKLLLIYVDEMDTWGESARPLYQAIVEQVLQLGLAGATVNIGAMGFGSRKFMHRKRLFGVSDDRPVTISVVDNESKIRAALPALTYMIGEGLAVLLDCELLYQTRDASEGSPA